MSTEIAWLLSQAIFLLCEGFLQYWLVNNKEISIEDTICFLSQRKCTTKVNSLKYNVIQDAFNYSTYSYSFQQQTYIGKKHADKRRVKGNTLFQTQKQNVIFKKQNHLITWWFPQKIYISSTEIELHSMCSQEVKCVPGAAINTSYSMAVLHFFFSLCPFNCLKLSASEIYIIIHLHHLPVIPFRSWKMDLI